MKIDTELIFPVSVLARNCKKILKIVEEKGCILLIKNSKPCVFLMSVKYMGRMENDIKNKIIKDMKLTGDRAKFVKDYKSLTFPFSS